MGYLFSQILVCLVLAFLLGLLLGWLIWSRREVVVADSDCEEHLRDAKRRIADLERDLAHQRNEAEARVRDAKQAAADAAAAAALPTPASQRAAVPPVDVPPADPPAADPGPAAGLFGAPAEAPIDDLKIISGIGPVIEKQLAGIGVTTYRQIARFSPDDVARVNDAIEVFQGRIEREDWIAQAARLHQEKYGDAA